MTYIFKKNINGKNYYYLRISKRIKDKVITKDIAYLGTNPEKIESRLNDIPQKYKGEIRKAYRNIKKYIESEYYENKIKKIKSNEFLDNNLLKKIDAVKLHYNSKFEKLDDLTKKEIFKNFIIDFAYNTTSIEGNTITLEEAEKLLNENIAPNDKTLREIYDLQNTEKVFMEILESNKEITHKLIIDIHDKLVENIDKRKGYRTHEIRVFKTTFQSSPYIYIKTDLDILLKWFNENKKKLHPVVLAGIFHQKFEKIHPFSDGNGRTGRILMCYMLMKKKYPPIIIRKKRRAEYLKFIDEGNKGDLNSSDPKYFKNLINYLGEEIIDNYWNNFLT